MPHDDLILKDKRLNVILYIPVVLLSTVYYFLSLLLHFPRLSLGSQGIQSQGLFIKTWANWDSLKEFTIISLPIPHSKKKLLQGMAVICGRNIGHGFFQQTVFTINNIYDSDIHDIVAKANEFMNRNIA
jgi:hypothetical protein